MGRHPLRQSHGLRATGGRRTFPYRSLAVRFCNERPRLNLNKGAGLDVSPAVRDYLTLKQTDVTDWRFVAFSEVPRGPWSTRGENNTFVINDRKKREKLAEAPTRGGGMITR